MEDRSINVGKVAMTMGGDYDPSKAYDKLVCVHYNYRSWVSRKPVSEGIVPSEANSAFWQMIADRGERGPEGQSYVDKTLVPIVDDLTTGGSANVLSAEQGKVLKQELTELESEIDKTIQGFISYDKSDLAAGHYYDALATANNPVSTSSNFYNICFSVNEGDEVIITTAGAGEGFPYVEFLADGSFRLRGGNADLSIQTYVIKIDALTKYIAVNCHKSALDSFIVEHKVGIGLQGSIKDINDKIERYEEAKVGGLNDFESGVLYFVDGTTAASATYGELNVSIDDFDKISAELGVPSTVYAIAFMSYDNHVYGGVLSTHSSGNEIADYIIDKREIIAKYPNVAYVRLQTRNTINEVSYTIYKANGIIPEIDNIKKSILEQGSPFRNMGHTPALFKRDYQMLVCYGQSLSNGSDSKTANDNPIDGCFMLGNSCASTTSTTLNPLRATNAPQHPIISATNSFSTLYYKYFDKTKKFLALSLGAGGRSIAQLSKAARIEQYAKEYDYAIGGAGQYESVFIKAIDNAVIATKGDLECPAIIFLQGERDYYNDAELGQQGDDTTGAYSSANDKSKYKARMMALKNDMQNDIMSRTGQSYKPIFCIYQCSGAFVVQKSYGDYMSINMAQLEFAEENDDVLLLPSPYFLPNYNSGHLSTNGYRWYGEYIGKYLFNYLATNSRIEPIKPLSINVQGNDVIVHLDNAVGRLHIDNYIVENAINSGFELWINDEYSQDNISSIEIAGHSIILHSSVNLAGKRIGVAYGGAKVSGTGNIHDSDRYIPLYSYWDDGEDKGASGQLVITHLPTNKDGLSLIGKPYPMQNWLASFYVEL